MQQHLGVCITTCCFEKELSFLSSLVASLRGAGVRCSVIIAASPDCCSYFTRLPEPRVALCAANRGKTLEILSKLGDLMFFDDDQALELGPIPQQQLILENWDLIVSSVHRDLKSEVVFDPAKLTPSAAQVASNYASKACIYKKAVQQLLHRHQFSHILVFNPAFYAERAIAEIAVGAGKRVIAFEGSCFADKKYLYEFRDGLEYREGFKERAAAFLKEPQVDFRKLFKLRRFLSTRRYLQRGSVFSHPEEPAKLPKESSEADRRCVLFLGQIAYDASISRDSGTVSQLDVVKRLLGWAREHPSSRVIIRLHPNTSLFSERKLSTLLSSYEHDGLPANVEVICGLEANTYSLMGQADVGITVSSQAGLEMVALGKPVVCLGKAFYGGLGITIDSDCENIESAIARAYQCETSRERRRIVVQVLYFWTNDYLFGVDRSSGQLLDAEMDRFMKMFGLDCV